MAIGCLKPMGAQKRDHVFHLLDTGVLSRRIANHASLTANKEVVRGYREAGKEPKYAGGFQGSPATAKP